MALVRCVDCSKLVSDSASACPNCGRPMQRATNAFADSPPPQTAGCLKIGFILLFATLVSVWIVGSINSCNAKRTRRSAEEAQRERDRAKAEEDVRREADTIKRLSDGGVFRDYTAAHELCTSIRVTKVPSSAIQRCGAAEMAYARSALAEKNVSEARAAYSRSVNLFSTRDVALEKQIVSAEQAEERIRDAARKRADVQRAQDEASCGSSTASVCANNSWIKEWT